MGSGEEVTYANPGHLDLKGINPALYSEIENTQQLRDRFRESSAYALDPARYDARMREDMAMANTSLQNRFAQMGLAGSSAAMGALNESDRRTMMAWDDRQVNDLLRSLQMEQALSGQISNGYLTIQNQYDNLQKNVANAQLQQQAQDQQMLGSIIGAGAMIGGTLLAGPAGGMAASGASNVLSAGNQSYVDNMAATGGMNPSSYQLGMYAPQNSYYGFGGY